MYTSRFPWLLVAQQKPRRLNSIKTTPMSTTSNVTATLSNQNNVQQLAKVTAALTAANAEILALQKKERSQFPSTIVPPTNTTIVQPTNPQALTPHIVITTPKKVAPVNLTQNMELARQEITQRRLANQEKLKELQANQAAHVTATSSNAQKPAIPLVRQNALAEITKPTAELDTIVATSTTTNVTATVTETAKEDNK